MTELLIATGNQHKFSEMAKKFAGSGIIPFPLSSQGIKLERPESGESYFENAKIKADEAFQKSQMISLADDSGLEVDCLGGQPGIHSARWAGENLTAAQRNQQLLERLGDLPPAKRTARYICEIVVVGPAGVIFNTQGICEGRITTEPRGSGGFGYDPIFAVQAADWKTFGQLPARIKNWLSHRAVALHKLLVLFREDEHWGDTCG